MDKTHQALTILDTAHTMHHQHDHKYQHQYKKIQIMKIPSCQLWIVSNATRLTNYRPTNVEHIDSLLSNRV